VILVIPAAPTPGQVVIGIVAVLVGALIATTSAFVARRSGNWLYHLGTAGGLLIVAGVVGQRSAAGGATGLWASGINVPVLGVQLDPVTAAGIIMTLFGLVLTLLLEHLPDGDQPRPLVHRHLEDDDAV
jgi:hypothetical protein